MRNLRRRVVAAARLRAYGGQRPDKVRCAFAPESASQEVLWKLCQNGASTDTQYLQGLVHHAESLRGLHWLAKIGGQYSRIARPERAPCIIDRQILAGTVLQLRLPALQARYRTTLGLNLVPRRTEGICATTCLTAHQPQQATVCIVTAVPQLLTALRICTSHRGCCRIQDHGSQGSQRHVGMEGPILV